MIWLLLLPLLPFVLCPCILVVWLVLIVAARLVMVPTGILVQMFAPESALARYFRRLG